MAPVATTALLLLPGAVGAEQLQYGVSTAGNWNDNVFGQSDFSARVSPYATVSDPEGELNWSLRYQPSYEKYLDLSEVSGFDHDLLGTLSWRFADRWNLSLRQAYVSHQNSVLLNEATEPGQEVALGFEDQEVRSNRTSAVLSRAFTPRDNLSLSLGYNALTFSGEARRSDPSSTSAALAYQHSFSERTSAGLRLSWVQQSRDNQVAEDDTSFFYNLSATFEHRFSPTLRLTAGAGPTLVDSSPPTEFTVPQFSTRTLFFQGVPVFLQAIDADTCNFQGVLGRAGPNRAGCAQDGDLLSPEDAILVSNLTVVPDTIDEQGRLVDSGQSEGTDLTYFAYLALNKDWEHWKGSVNYTRSNSESANFGSSSVADSLYATLSWKPDPRWTVSLSAGLTLQEQLGEQVVPFAVDLENVDASTVGVTSVPELAQVKNLVASTGGNSLEYRTESVSLTVNRNIGRRASAFASLYWYTQEQTVESVLNDLTRDVDALRLSIGVRWNFEPVRF